MCGQTKPRDKLSLLLQMTLRGPWDLEASHSVYAGTWHRAVVMESSRHSLEC